jgi:hypothetical protein
MEHPYAESEEYILTIFRKCMVDPKRLNLLPSQKLVIDLTLKECITFHEAESLVYNTVFQNLDRLSVEVESQRRRNLDASGKKDQILHHVDLVRSFYVKLWTLFHWLNSHQTGEAVRNSTADADLIRTLDGYEDHFEELEPFRQFLHRIVADSDGTPKILAKKLWKKRNEIGRHYYLQEDSRGREISFHHCTFAIDTISEISPKMGIAMIDFLQPKMYGRQEELDNLFEHYNQWLWSLNKEEWLQVFQLMPRYWIPKIQSSILSIDLVDAAIEKFGLHKVFEDLLTIAAKGRDTAMILYLLKFILNEETSSEKIDTSIQILNASLELPDPDNDSRLKKHYDLLRERIRGIVRLLHRWPLIQYRIHHSKQQGATSSLEEKGYLEFLEWEPYQLPIPEA